MSGRPGSPAGPGGRRLAWSPNVSAVLALLAAFALSAGTVALLLRHARRLPHARPDARGLHERPVPRVGGLAVLAGGDARGLAPRRRSCRGR